MSEQEPNNEQEPFFIVHHEGGELEATRDNTMLFLHDDQKYDHLFIMLEAPTEDSPMEGLFCFRDSIQNFDAVAQYMIDQDFAWHPNEEPSQMDKEAYERHQASKAAKAVALEETTQIPLTPRHERLVQALGYYLTHNHLTPEDFDGTGDLMI